MKLGEFITIFPPLVLAEPRKDIPFSVLYETFSRIIAGFFEFLEWAQQQERLPPQERNTAERQRWLDEYRRILEDIQYMLDLDWRPNDPAEPWLGSIRNELNRLLGLIDAFDGANPPASSEIEPILELIFRFLQEASDDDFSLKELFSKLRSMDETISRLPRQFENRTDPDMRTYIETGFSVIASWKHKIGDAVRAASTH
jgi:hypothetical protein